MCKKMLFRTFRRNYLADVKFTVILLDNKNRYLGQFDVDYTDPTDKSNIDLVLDLYNLDATLRDISTNKYTLKSEIDVNVNTDHPLFKYTVWGGALK